MCFLLVQIRVRHMKTNTLPYNNNYDNANFNDYYITRGNNGDQSDDNNLNSKC